MSKKLIKKKKKSTKGHTIQNCVFNGVKWDAKALESVNLVGEALILNSKALLNMAELFKSQNIEIECLVKIGKD